MTARGRLFNVKRAADYLGVSATRVRRLIARREIADVRTKDGRLEGVYQADCDAWVERRRRPAISERPLSGADVDQRVRAMVKDSERVFAH